MLSTLEAGDAMRSSVQSLISSAPAKNELFHYTSTVPLLKCVRQYIETSQQRKMDWKPQKLCLLCSYSQSNLDIHVSRLAASLINDDRRCRSGRDRRWFGRTTLPACKAFNESRPRRLRRPRHLMSLVLPVCGCVGDRRLGSMP